MALRACSLRSKQSASDWTGVASRCGPADIVGLFNLSWKLRSSGGAVHLHYVRGLAESPCGSVG